MNDLFPGPTTSFKSKLQSAVQRLASSNIFIGTSSWKYEGWTGQIYDEQRYCYRGKFAKTRFERDCLVEYAETFKTVCVDAAYYQFPSAKYLNGLVEKVPGDFLFTFKVTDDITLKRFTNLPRFGIKAGKPNDNFLNAELFVNAFLKPCEPFRNNVGLLMFEFSRFYSTDYQHGRDFIADLDAFFSKLPKGWNYGVELRNKDWLQPDYFAVLRKHGVVHVFNNWSMMPTVGEQMVVAGSDTSDALVAARFRENCLCVGFIVGDFPLLPTDGGGRSREVAQTRRVRARAVERRANSSRCNTAAYVARASCRSALRLGIKKYSPPTVKTKRRLHSTRVRTGSPCCTNTGGSPRADAE